jgi:hypothetical protein
MNSKYYPPVYLASNFHCLRCGVYAKQYWGSLKTETRYHTGGQMPVQVLKTNNGFRVDLPNQYVASKCDHCNNFTLWHDKVIIFPRTSVVEAPNEDLTAEISSLYKEAATILSDSPRAAAALLRLALQLLLKELGGKGKHIDADIKTIVASGIDPQVQKAMDIVRVFGNNGAHPGEIQLKEDPELVKKMFELINFIATKMITSKKEITNLFEGLPEGVKEAIEKRDNTEKRDE